MRLSELHSSKENHWFVRYEDLVADPREVLMELCGFINVPFEERVLSDYASAAN